MTLSYDPSESKIKNSGENVYGNVANLQGLDRRTSFPEWPRRLTYDGINGPVYGVVNPEEESYRQSQEEAREAAEQARISNEQRRVELTERMEELINYFDSLDAVATFDMQDAVVYTENDVTYTMTVPFTGYSVLTVDVEGLDLDKNTDYFFSDENTIMFVHPIRHANTRVHFTAFFLALKETTFPFKFATPIYWTPLLPYDAFTVVLNNGSSYISRQPVPAGTSVSNTDYWMLWAEPNAQMNVLRNLVNVYNNHVNDVERNLNSEIDARKIDIEKAHVFETVADMKAGENLSVGAICHTNGFHTSGDGGAAWYVISATGTANEMDVIACGELFANLIVGETVNLSALGVTSDNDVSPFFNRAIEIKDGKPITVNQGVYDIDTPISLKTTDRIIHNGFVLYKPETIAFEITSNVRSDYNPVDNNALHELFDGDVFTIWADRYNNAGKIGMTLSEDREVTKRSFIVKNCNFIGLQVGFIDSAIRSYLYEFEHCQFQYCDVCYQYGKNGIAKYDSGENIHFDYCVFANSAVAVKLFADSIVLSINDSSFDFCTNVFTDASPNGYHAIKVIGGHFEGIGSPTTLHQTSPATVLYGLFYRSLINIVAANVLISNKHKFSEGLSEYGYDLVLSGSTNAPRITIDSCSFSSTNDFRDFSVYIGEYVNCDSSKNVFRQNTVYLPTAFQACTPFFDNDTAGSVTIQDASADLKYYRVTNAANAKFTIEENSEINKKVLAFTTGSGAPIFRTKEITGVSGKQIAVNRLCNIDSSNVAIEITFEDGTTQQVTPYQHRPTDIPVNVFKYADTSWGFLRLPGNVKHIVARATLPENSTGIFGGIIVAVI